MQTMNNKPRSIRPFSTASGNADAHYDPSAKQICYSKRANETGLFGTVIDGSLARLQSSKIIKGEILEIIDAPREVKDVKPREPQTNNRLCTDPTQYEPKETEPTKPPQSTGTSPALSQNDLLKKQQNLPFHSKQSLSLLQMHQNERENIKHAHFSSERQREEAWIEMEDRHERELLELQDRHQREQIEIMNEMLRGVNVREQSDETRQQHYAQQQHETEFPVAEAAHSAPNIFPIPVRQGYKGREQNDLHRIKDKGPDEPPAHERTDELDFIPAEPIDAAQINLDLFPKPLSQRRQNQEIYEHKIEQQHFTPPETIEAAHIAHNPFPKHVTQRLNRKVDDHEHGQQQKFVPAEPKEARQIDPNPVPKPVRKGQRNQGEQQIDFTLAEPKVATLTTPAPTSKPRTTPVNPTEQSTQTHDEPILDKATLEKRKTEEIKALLRDKTLDREQRHNSLIEIKERYSQLFASLTSGAELSVVERRKSELHAIMKDRTLTKAERLKKMAEVKAKYPVGTHGSRRATVDSGVRPSIKSRVDAAVNQSKRHPKRSSICESVEEAKPGQEEKKERERGARLEDELDLEAARSSLTGRRTSSGDARAKTTSHEPKKHDFIASTNFVEEPKRDLPKEPSTRTVESTDEEDEIIPIQRPKRGLTNESSAKKVESEDEESYIEYATSTINVGRGLEKSESARLFSDSAPSSRSNSNRSMQLDPLETAEVNKAPIKSIIKLLKNNDPALSVLKLDGRGKIKDDDWEALFDTLEKNTSLTHLSLSRCGLTDEKATGLVLALIENSTLVELHLMTNREITDVTGKGIIKVLKESNSTLKQLDMSRTRVKKQTLKDIQEIMDDRDEEKKRAAAQALRALKVKALMKVTASDAIAKSKQQVALDLSSSDNESEASRSKPSKQKSGRSMRKSDKSKSNKSAGSASSRNSGRGSKDVLGRGRGRGGNAMRASVTARQMATLGGDIVSGVGADAKTLREQRKMRGECPDCGQKCFEKSIFKTKPLTIPHKVFEGRCLKCRPM